jgi:hypothetical protein
LTLCSKHSDIASEFIHLFVLASKMAYPANANVPLIFDLTPSMNQEDVLKEIHHKVEYSNLDNKQTMQVMICVTLAFEDHCAGERAAAAVTGNLYVPPTRVQYLSFIDRPAHQAYLLAIAAGPAPAGPDVFVEPLADAHTELITAFDVFIANKRWNAIFAGGGGGAAAVAVNVAATGAQNLKIETVLAVVMKDCNSHLTHALCQALNTPQMAAYQYLTNLENPSD